MNTAEAIKRLAHHDSIVHDLVDFFRFGGVYKRHPAGVTVHGDLCDLWGRHGQNVRFQTGLSAEIPTAGHEQDGWGALAVTRTPQQQVTTMA